MKMRSYMKELEREVKDIVFKETVETSFTSNKLSRKKILMTFVLSLLLLSAFCIKFIENQFKSISVSDESVIQLTSAPATVTATKKSVISIPTGTAKANPFLPYRDLGETLVVSDVPTFSLVEPPEMVNENSDAARVMDTIVSGILFDKYNPSAILNIEGNDYLVKKGDVVNNYKVLNILQDSVTVKLGNNVYKAGIGEILTEGTLNYNDVSNLDKKFGGVK